MRNWRGGILAVACAMVLGAGPAAASPPVLTTFQPVFTGIPAGSPGANIPTGVAAADVNKDGRPDILATFAPNTPTGQNGLGVLLNTTAPGAATPTFSAPVYFDTTADARTVVTADVNTDGRPDAIVGNLMAGGGSVLINMTTPGDTSPSFAPATSFPSSNIATPTVGTADFNADGKPDMFMNGAFVNTGIGVVSVVLNTTAHEATTPTFSAVTSFNSANKDGGVLGFAAGDVNGDHKPDLLVANGGTLDGADGVSILTNTTADNATTPAFSAPDNFPSGVGPVAIAALDVNGDGRLDVGTGDTSATTGGGSSWQMNATTNPSTLAFGPLKSFATPDTGLAGQIRSGDFNGDGRIDVLSSYSLLPLFRGYSIQINNTPPGATTASFAPAAHTPDTEVAYDAVVADLNGDGRPDVLKAASIQDPAGTLNLVGAVGALMNRSAPIVRPSPADLIFPPQALGTTSVPQTLTVTNGGAWKMLTKRAVTGTAADFTISSDTCSNVVVNVDRTCTLKVAFAPKAAGERAATLNLNPGLGGSLQQIRLYGTTATVTDRTAPTCKVTGVKKRYKPKAFGKGVKVAVSCNEPASLLSQLIIRVRDVRGRVVAAKVGELILGEKSTRFGTGKRNVTIKPSRKLRQRLGRRFKLSVVVTATDGSNNARKSIKKLTVR